ncbi:beta family protein [Neorhizobium sp. T786]|nr:beta family protein [Neorhizobium xiangyangii]
MSYIPVLSIRPAEVVALSELPDLSKDRMTPLILVKPWLGGGALSRGLDKISHGFPSRPWFAELDPEYYPAAGSDTYSEIEQLRDPAHGFGNWIEFVGQLHQAMPVLQLRGAQSSEQLLAQIDRAAELHHHRIGVRIDRTFGGHAALPVAPIVDLLALRPNIQFTIVIDYGQRDSKLLASAIPAIQDVIYIRERLPESVISLSSTTFPSAFGARNSQEIFERNFFNIVNSEVGGLVFSDRGSARASEQGGGGVPRPRIDLPTQSHWNFFRSDCVKEDGESADDFRERRIEAYGQMADMATESPDWDENLNVWGTQLIKITQLRSPFGITSPAKATACRINIHLTKQSLYGVDVSAEDLEEEWVD